MTAKFTKGPWRIERRVRGDFIFASEERLNAGFNICKVSGPESSYNASLIACAPEMYEQNEEYISILKALLADGYVGYADKLQKALTVSKKARGEV